MDLATRTKIVTSLRHAATALLAGGVDVGFTWQAWDQMSKGPVERKIESRKEFNGKEVFLVSHDGKKVGQQIIPVDEIDGEIRFDERNLASKLKGQEASKQAMEKEAQQKADVEDVDGFDKSMSPLKRKKVLNALNKSVRVQGKFSKRKDAIRRLVDDGYVVKDHPKFRRVLQDPNANFFTEKDLTKTGLDYAEHLIKHGRG